MELGTIVGNTVHLVAFVRNSKKNVAVAVSGTTQLKNSTLNILTHDGRPSHPHTTVFSAC